LQKLLGVKDVLIQTQVSVCCANAIPTLRWWRLFGYRVQRNCGGAKERKRQIARRRHCHHHRHHQQQQQQ